MWIFISFIGVLATVYALWFLFSSVGSISGLPADIVESGFKVVGVVVGGFGAYYGCSQRRKIIICATSDGLTANKRPGVVFSFSDAKLGPWALMGTALHLQCGPHRFVLGGRDHRIAPGTRLQAPDAGYGLPVDIDAWMWAPDFDELLTMVGRRSGLDVRRPAPGEPTRCLLFPNPLLVQKMGPWAIREKNRLMRSASQPGMAIDVGEDAIRVIDPNSNALVASASLAQVTATPSTYRPSYGHWYPTTQHVASDVVNTYLSTTPGMVVSVPGLQPPTIGCRDFAGLQRRFSWRGNVPLANEPAAYVVSGADWLMLVEKLGLAPYLEKHGEQG